VNRWRGFTLVEVMVALAVVGLALPALLFALYQHVDAAGYLRDKSIAAMVAADRLARMRILSKSTGKVLQGEDGGVTRMAERDWHWWLQSQPTQVADFYRVEIDVAADPQGREHPLYTLVAFMNADLRTETGAGDAGQ